MKTIYQQAKATLTQIAKEVKTLRPSDKPYCRQVINDSADKLCKDNQFTEQQRNWLHTHAANLHKALKLSIFAIAILFTTATTTAAQNYCGAQTTKGTSCKMRVKEPGQRCFHHGGSTKTDKAGIYQDTHRCGAQTTKGTPCRNRVREAGQRCHHHNH